jgi:hypothetical protein
LSTLDNQVDDSGFDDSREIDMTATAKRASLAGVAHHDAKVNGAKLH